MASHMSRLLRSHYSILLHTGLVVVPLLAFTGILLGLVYVNMWDRSSYKD